MHGIKTNVLLNGTRAIAAIATGVIGLIATASAAPGAEAAALDAAFPLNKATLVTDVRSAMGKAGSGGTLLPALEAIYDQVSPIVIVVRVPIDAEDQDEATIGTAANYSGVYALLAAEAKTKYRPRVLGAPGLDSQAVTAALTAVAKKLRGRVYAAAEGETIADVATYRENFGDRELTLIWPNWSNAFAGDAVARALGMRTYIDETQGWHKSLSNVAVSGVTGISEDLFFDIEDESTDVAALNAAGIVTLIRSPSGGFVYWGNITCSDEPLYKFEPAVRTSQILQDEIAQGLVWASDKPLTKGLIKDILETINAKFRSLTVQDRIIGATAWFDGSLNPEGNLAAGQLVIDYDFTPAAPLEGLTLNQRITDRYYANLADALAATLAA